MGRSYNPVRRENPLPEERRKPSIILTKKGLGHLSQLLGIPEYEVATISTPYEKLCRTHNLMEGEHYFIDRRNLLKALPTYGSKKRKLKKTRSIINF